MIDVIHPTGNANVRQVLRALIEIGNLGCFHTTLGTTNSESRLLNRRYFDLPPDKMSTSPGLELIRLLLQKLPGAPGTRSSLSPFTIDSVYRFLDQKVARLIGKEGRSIKAVYAYEDGALETFQTAKKQGIMCFYDLPIAYWEKSQELYKQEAERLPEWAITLPGLNDSEAKLRRKIGEVELADHVICPSEFVKESLPHGILKTKSVSLARFGCEHEIPDDGKRQKVGRQSGSLRVLFVGALTQRKGLADILAAFRKLKSNNIRLTLIGAMTAPASFYQKQWRGLPVEYIPPQNRLRVLRLMREHDILILPSLVEGRALVQLEALGMGLPLIITPNTGGEDCVIEGETGFMVSIRSPQAISEKLDCLASDPGHVKAMKEAAFQHSKTITWKKYRKIIQNAVSML